MQTHIELVNRFASQVCVLIVQILVIRRSAHAFQVHGCQQSESMSHTDSLNDKRKDITYIYTTTL